MHLESNAFSNASACLPNKFFHNVVTINYKKFINLVSLFKDFSRKLMISYNLGPIFSPNNFNSF